MPSWDLNLDHCGEGCMYLKTTIIHNNLSHFPSLKISFSNSRLQLLFFDNKFLVSKVSDLLPGQIKVLNKFVLQR